MRKDTRGRVLEAAVRLFNERGTAAVSTNHVAKEAGISPGNLYYHFRDKEEIVRVIFDRLDTVWGSSYVLPANREPTVSDVRAMVEETYSGIWEYRFFYRELGALTLRDPELARRFGELRRRGLSGTEELLRTFVRAGVISGLRDEASLLRLAKILMLVAEFWLPFEETGREVSEDGLAERGADIMIQVLTPYLVSGETDSADDDNGGRR